MPPTEAEPVVGSRATSSGKESGWDRNASRRVRQAPFGQSGFPRRSAIRPACIRAVEAATHSLSAEASSRSRAGVEREYHREPFGLSANGCSINSLPRP